MDDTPIDRFRSRILDDPSRLHRLLGEDDPQAFLAACLELSRELDIPLDAATLQAAMRNNRRAWFEANAL